MAHQHQHTHSPDPEPMGEVLARLVKKLIAATSSGTLVWSVDPTDPSFYRTVNAQREIIFQAQGNNWPHLFVQGQQLAMRRQRITTNQSQQLVQAISDQNAHDAVWRGLADASYDDPERAQREAVMAVMRRGDPWSNPFDLDDQDEIDADQIF